FNRIVPLPEGTVSLVRESPRAQRLRSISNWQDVVALLDQHPRLTAVSPVVSGPALALSGVARASVALIGMDPVRYERIIPVSEDLIAGAFRVGAGHAVIGSELAGDLGLDVGDKLRSEEHTSELQSRENLVCRLLLEKKR